MVTITLEMVDEVINRTGVEYKTAKEALELYEGDVLEAIIYLENLQKSGAGKGKSEFSAKTNEIVDLLKDLVNKGIVTKILVEHKDKIIMDIPVLAGGLAAFIFAPATLTAIVAAVATGCVLKVVKEDGTIMNLNEMTQDAFKSVVETTEQTINSFKGKAQNVKEDFEEKVKEATEEVLEDDIEIDVDPSRFETEDDSDDYIVEAKFMEHGAEDEEDEHK